MIVGNKHFDKYKETPNFILYLEKTSDNNQREMIVYHKKKGISMQCICTEALLQLFLDPEQFKRIYLNQEKQNIRK